MVTSLAQKQPYDHHSVSEATLNDKDRAHNDVIVMWQWVTIDWLVDGLQFTPRASEVKLAINLQMYIFRTTWGKGIPAALEKENTGTLQKQYIP